MQKSGNGTYSQIQHLRKIGKLHSHDNTLTEAKGCKKYKYLQVFYSFTTFP